MVLTGVVSFYWNVLKMTVFELEDGPTRRKCLFRSFSLLCAIAK